MNLEKNWIFCFIIELVFYVVFAFILFILSDSVAFSIIPVLAKWAYTTFVIQKPGRSKFYRLPSDICKVIVLEKRIHNSIITEFFCEWIIFNTVEGQQIKAYVTVPFNAKERRNVSEFNIGDTGMLHYRKGKKHLYFEEFVKFELGDVENHDS